MPKLQTGYQITVSDYRKAAYYGLFLRCRTPFRILFLVLIFALIYAIAAAYGLGTANPLVFFLAAAYLVWGLVMFAGTESSIRAYLKSPNCLLGCDLRVTLDDTRARVDVPPRGVNESYALGRLSCAFELHALFLLYATPRQAYLLPKRALSEEEQIALRATLRRRLGDRFGTRFEKKTK